MAERWGPGPEPAETEPIRVEVGTDPLAGPPPAVQSLRICIPIELLGEGARLGRPSASEQPFELRLGSAEEAESQPLVIASQRVESGLLDIRLRPPMAHPGSKSGKGDRPATNARAAYRIRPPPGLIVDAELGTSTASPRIRARVTDLSPEGLGVFVKTTDWGMAKIKPHYGMTFVAIVYLPNQDPLDVVCTVRRVVAMRAGMNVGLSFPTEESGARSESHDLAGATAMRWQRIRMRLERGEG